MPRRPAPGVVIACILLASGLLSGGEWRDLRPGVSTAEDVAQLVGAPPDGGGGPFANPFPGFRELKARYDARGLLENASLRLNHPLSPAAAAFALGLDTVPRPVPGQADPATGAQRYSMTFPEDGLSLEVRQGLVEEIRLMARAEMARLASDGTAEPDDTASVLPPDRTRIDGADPTPAELDRMRELAATGFEDSGAGMPRLLEVPELRYAHVLGPDGAASVVAMARVRTAGLRGRDIRMVASLRSEPDDGTRCGEASFADKVLYDDSEWQEARIVIAGSMPPTPGARRVLRWHVSCAGLEASADVECPVLGAPAEAGVPALTCSGLTITADTEYRGLRGILLETDVRADNLTGNRIVGRIALRLPDGTPVETSPGADPSLRDASGRFTVQGVDTIRFTEAHWQPFRVIVPRDALALPPNTSRVILTWILSAGGLTRVVEQDIVAVPPSPAAADEPRRGN